MTTTGRVVAMASYPDYDPSVWTGGITQRQFNKLFGKSGGQPIIDWTTQGQYAPGSTFKVTSTAAAVADGYPLYGLYGCPGSVNIAGHTFGNDGEPSLGSMTFSEALVQSCDTVYYNLGYKMYLHDHPGVNGTKSPNSPVQKMQTMELAWGFGQATGVDLPAENPGTVPTGRGCSTGRRRKNGHDWCRNGKDTELRAADRGRGLPERVDLAAGEAVNAAIGQGDVPRPRCSSPTRTSRSPTAARCTAHGSARRWCRRHRQGGQRITRRSSGTCPSPGQALAYIRTALAPWTTQGTAAGAFGGFPLNQVCVAGKTGTAERRRGRHLGVRLVRAAATTRSTWSWSCSRTPVTAPTRPRPRCGQIWDGIYGLEGHKAARARRPGAGLAARITSTGAITPPSGYAGLTTPGASDAGPVDELLRAWPDHAAAGGRSPPAGRAPWWPGRSPGTRRCGTWTGC